MGFGNHHHQSATLGLTVTQTGAGQGAPGTLGAVELWCGDCRVVGLHQSASRDPQVLV